MKVRWQRQSWGVGVRGGGGGIQDKLSASQRSEDTRNKVVINATLISRFAEGHYKIASPLRHKEGVITHKKGKR